MNDFAILSPYLIPASMPKKKVNVGDGFILRGIERQLGQFSPSRILTGRRAPDPSDLARLAGVRTVILGGANQLDDRFCVWPGLTAEKMRKMPTRFVPFAIGINGLAMHNQGFSAAALEVLRAIHERVEYSSWRCPITLRVLEAALPDLKGRFLMTGCPVLYDAPLLEERPFSTAEASVAVTVTERDDFWQREAGTLRYVAERFRKARKFLVLHQVFDRISALERSADGWPVLGALLNRRARLRLLARRLGFEIVAPGTADATLAFYKGVDLHFGSRLHAHLHFLSQAKRSWLTYVDDRMAGFSEALGFPLCTPETFDRHRGFDFDICRNAAVGSHATMQEFVRSLVRV